MSTRAEFASLYSAANGSCGCISVISRCRLRPRSARKAAKPIFCCRLSPRSAGLSKLALSSSSLSLSVSASLDFLLGFFGALSCFASAAIPAVIAAANAAGSPAKTAPTSDGACGASPTGGCIGGC